METFENLKKQVASVDITNRDEILDFKDKEELQNYLDKRIFQILEDIKYLENQENLTNSEENILIIRKLEFSLLNKNIETLKKLISNEI